MELHLLDILPDLLDALRVGHAHLSAQPAHGHAGHLHLRRARDRRQPAEPASNIGGSIDGSGGLCTVALVVPASGARGAGCLCDDVLTAVGRVTPRARAFLSALRLPCLLAFAALR